VDALGGSLGLEGSALLSAAEEIFVRRMKRSYEALLKDYRVLFSRAITEAHKQLFAHILVHPNQLNLFEDDLSQKGTE
jgi:hypothetical protein